jgi:TPR repeat protein
MRAYRLVVPAIALASGLAAAASGDFESAAAALREGDYATALERARPLAARGDAASQVLLGSMYSEGKGVAQDDAEAARWYRMAAEQGDAQGQFALGQILFFGLGSVEPGPEEAVAWLRKASEQGHARAQGDLAIAYAVGAGVEQDDAEAARWFRRAAEQGFPFAQGRLGRMYYNGHGVPRDPVLAYVWFDLAAANGDVDEALSRDSVGAELDPEQRRTAEDLAREYRARYAPPD